MKARVIGLSLQAGAGADGADRTLTQCQYVADAADPVELGQLAFAAPTASKLGQLTIGALVEVSVSPA